LVCKGKRKGQKEQKKAKFQAFLPFLSFFDIFASAYHSPGAPILNLYPDSDRFAALTGASPRPYTPRFANARRFFTVGNKESF